jgi:predicted nucleotidyltransferase
MGATALDLFGPTVRDEAHASSDLDLFVDYDPAKRLSLLDLVGIKQFPEEQHAAACPMLRTDIEQSAIRVF